MINHKEQLLWAIVEVRSGIPLDVKLFREFKSAKLYNRLLRRQLYLEEDESGIFPIDVSDLIYEAEIGEQCLT